jgi:hypothetical protein
MTTVTATRAKNSLLELLRGVEERGETVQITRNGDEEDRESSPGERCRRLPDA